MNDDIYICPCCDLAECTCFTDPIFTGDLEPEELWTF